jgi:hypothetical protein
VAFKVVAQPYLNTGIEHQMKSNQREKQNNEQRNYKGHAPLVIFWQAKVRITEQRSMIFTYEHKQTPLLTVLRDG